MSNLLKREKYTIDLDTIEVSSKLVNTTEYADDAHTSITKITTEVQPEIRCEYFLNNDFSKDYHVITVKLPKTGKTVAEHDATTGMFVTTSATAADVSSVTADTIISNLTSAIEKAIASDDKCNEFRRSRESMDAKLISVIREIKNANN